MEQVTNTALEQIPSFCEHYEPLLVEEIALARYPTSVHHGKCAIIGYLPERSNGLESLMVPSLPKDVQLPDGTFSVRLCFDNYRGSIPRNCTVRAYGTILLHGPSDSPYTSSRDLIGRLYDLKQDAEQTKLSTVKLDSILREERETMRNNFQPFLEVQGCERVSQARELISCNLRLKRINRRIAPLIRDIESGI